MGGSGVWLRVKDAEALPTRARTGRSAVPGPAPHDGDLDVGYDIACHSGAPEPCGGTEGARTQPVDRRAALNGAKAWRLRGPFASSTDLRHQAAREHRLAKDHEFGMPLPDVGRQLAAGIDHRWGLAGRIGQELDPLLPHPAGEIARSGGFWPRMRLRRRGERPLMPGNGVQDELAVVLPGHHGFLQQSQ